MAELLTYHLTAEQIEEEQAQIRAAQKDPRYFEPLYTRYYGRIAAYLYHRLEDKEQAFEMTAQVFYKALDNLGRYKSMGVPFSAWLFRIAGNELNQWFRKHKTKRMLSIDEDGLLELRADVEEGGSGQQDAHLFDALQQLSPEDMDMVNMRFFEKRPFREMSEIYGITESACKMRLYRILDELKEKLKRVMVRG